MKFEDVKEEFGELKEGHSEQIKFVNISDDQVYDYDRDVFKEAKRKGCEVTFPEPNELQIDIDSEAAASEFTFRIRTLEQTTNWVVEKIVKRPSVSGPPHQHISVFIEGKNFTDAERVLFQFMLGSDIIRETLNAIRISGDIKNPSILFTPKLDGKFTSRLEETIF